VVCTHGPESDAQRARSCFWVLRAGGGAHAHTGDGAGAGVGALGGAVVGTIAVHPGKGGSHQVRIAGTSY
jgi:hypothetical protein